MTSQEILTADPLDIIFENRNKLYGAYTLRKHYNGRLTGALMICMGLMFLFFLLFRTQDGREVQRFSPDAVVIRDFTLSQPLVQIPIPKVPQQARQPAMTQKRFTNQIEIIDDDRDIQAFTRQDEMTGAIPGIATASGITFPGVAMDFTQKSNQVIEPFKEPGKAMVQSEPAFPGGSVAWLDFLKKNLMVPGTLEEGEKRTVLIRFVVATDGSVQSFEVVQSGGSLYDREVIRVLKKMPKWKPAIQNNLPVVRSFSQPVTFMGMSE